VVYLVKVDKHCVRPSGEAREKDTASSSSEDAYAATLGRPGGGGTKLRSQQRKEYAHTRPGVLQEHQNKRKITRRKRIKERKEHIPAAHAVVLNECDSSVGGSAGPP
jgi:hypothetical protein